MDDKYHFGCQFTADLIAMNVAGMVQSPAWHQLPHSVYCSALSQRTPMQFGTMICTRIACSGPVKAWHLSLYQDHAEWQRVSLPRLLTQRLSLACVVIPQLVLWSMQLHVQSCPSTAGMPNDIILAAMTASMPRCYKLLLRRSLHCHT